MSHALCRHLFNEEPRKVMEKIKSYHWSQQRRVVFILADALNSVVFSLFSAARTTAFIFSSSSPLFLFGFVCSASMCWTCCSSALILQMWPPIHLHFIFHANCRFESSWSNVEGQLHGALLNTWWSCSVHLLHSNCHQFSEWGCVKAAQSFSLVLPFIWVFLNTFLWYP